MTTSHSADLHTHTYLSDGDPDQSPDAVCRHAAEAGIKHLSITDHDHVLPETKRQALARQYQIDLIPGCEFSTLWKNPHTGENVIIHLGGHWLDIGDPLIQQILQRNQNLNYEGYSKEMLLQYRKHRPHPALRDIDAAYEQIKRANPYSKHLGKRAVANFLVSQGCEPNRQEAYRFFAHGGKAHVSPTEILHYVLFEEAVTAITCRSLCTLNHLFYYHLDDAGNQALLCDFKELGGQCLETVYSPYDQTKRAALFQLCENYQLLPNCGSDRHDTTRPFIHGPDLLFLMLQNQQLKQYGTLNQAAERN